jgi:phosphohistidine phosphatase
MRQLLLLRHAKAERDGWERDHDRTLTDRGRRDAVRVGRFLAAAAIVPSLAITSSAVRARVTAELVIEAGGWECPLRRVAALYESTIEEVLAVVRKGGGAANLLLVGHEPTWSVLASALIGGGSVRLPTAGLAIVGFDLDDWAEAAPGSGTLRGLITPAMLPGHRPAD